MRALLSEWLPRACAVCGDDAPAWGLCRGCLRTLPGRRRARCAGCALPPHAGACTQGTGLDGILCALDYAPPVDRWMLAFKHQGLPALGRPLGWLAAGTARRAPAGTLLVPVPPTLRGLAERGFDPALELARPVARRARLRLAPRALRRTRDTAAQKTLDAAARRANLAGAFAADARQVAGRDVLLFDDVMTTGATLSEAAGALRAAGATSVRALVVMRRA